MAEPQESASDISLNNDLEKRRPSATEAQAARKASIYRRRSSVVSGRWELTEEDAYEVTGFSYPTWKKWWTLSVIFAIQVSMNMNASLYANGIDGIAKKFAIGEQTARVGQMIFLVCYAFGCELWAPWSEEFGRKPILQSSLFLVNIWQIPCALAPNFGTIVVCRALGGLSSAGGSVTLGMVADMWEPDVQQFAVGFIVFSSVGGSIVGPIVGGFVEEYLSLPWVFWIQLIFGGFVQVVHFFLVPETRSSILLDREAKRRRKSGSDPNVYGPGEMSDEKLTFKDVINIWTRPFIMLAREPIVLCLSLLSGFSDALIFTFLESYSPVFKQWNFSTVQLGLAFIPIGIGYFIAYFSFFPDFYLQNKMRQKHGSDAVQPERRLKLLLFEAPLEAIGLFGFAWTSLGPPIPWIAPLIFSALVGIANYAIYMATIDYMVAAYGPYSSSATGGNGFARDFLAGIAALYATPMYKNIGTLHLEWASTILGCIAILVTIPIYVFYFNGPAIRARSHFAQELAAEKKGRGGRGPSVADVPAGGAGIEKLEEGQDTRRVNDAASDSASPTLNAQTGN